MKYNYLFGPVPSRRLGMSLGVDLVPKKVCSLDCVYCEVGKTTKLTTEREEYIKLDKVVDELNHYFEHNPDPDYITFSGSGEPTLNSRLGEILDFIKQKKSHIPLAVLTNGTTLQDKNVREALMHADVVLPSLDAATQEVFNRINRPEKSLTIEAYIQGIIDFKREFKGKIWLEILILPGYNDSDEEILALKEAIEKISPDSIQLNSLDRPGTISGLHTATKRQLEEISATWGFANVEIIASAPEHRETKAYRNDTEAVIIETITRRPCTLNDLVKILGLQINEINKYLDVLEADRKIERVEQERGVFYQVKEKYESH